MAAAAHPIMINRKECRDHKDSRPERMVFALPAFFAVKNPAQIRL
jgi:hypothetical protein